MLLTLKIITEYLQFVITKITTEITNGLNTSYLQLVGHHIIKSCECGFKRLQSIHVFSAGSSIHSWPAVKICLFREDWNCSKLTYPLLTQHVKTWLASLQTSYSSSWLLWGAWLQFNEDQILMVCLPSQCPRHFMIIGAEHAFAH